MKTMNKEIEDELAKLLLEISKYCKKQIETLLERFSILWHTKTHHSLSHRFTENTQKHKHTRTHSNVQLIN